MNCEPAKRTLSFSQLLLSTCVTAIETGHHCKENQPSNCQIVLGTEYNIKEGAEEVQDGE